MRRISWQLVMVCVVLALSVAVSAQDDETITPQDLADEDGQFTEVNGAAIYYIERGDVDDPAVILIHGFGGSTFTWRDNIGALVEAGYHVVALDLPPFGLSDKSADVDHTRSAYADYVASLMDVLEIDSATIIGHSMGGSTTAYFAVQYPERVDRLVFVAGGIFGGDGVSIEADGDSGGSPLGALAGIDIESEQAAFILETALIPATFGAIIETAYYDPSMMTNAVVDGYARPILIDGWAEGFLAYWGATDSDPISLDDLIAATDAPVLIQWGLQDTWVPIEMGYTMADALADSQVVQLIEYENVGHLPMEETTEQFNQDLITFLGAS